MCKAGEGAQELLGCTGALQEGGLKLYMARFDGP